MSLPTAPEMAPSLCQGTERALVVGVLHLEVHLPQVTNLKQKRQAFKGLKERLRSRYNVSVAEDSELSDLWQRAGLTIVSVASQRDPLARLFDTIEREAEQQIPGHLVSTDIDFLELDEGAGGWDDDWQEAES